MPTIEGVRLKLRNNVCIPLTQKKRGSLLKYKDFTIISNNCWGGTVYEAHNLPKKSPTVGLFFMADDYIKFLKNLKQYISAPLSFIPPEKSRWASCKEIGGSSTFGSYPIGVLELPDSKESIEIFFLHYHSEEEAYDKWTRRCARINWDRLLVKFNDQNGCTEKNISDFQALEFKNKVCFTINPAYQGEDVILIPAPESHKCVRASYEPFGRTKEVNITNILNSL